MSVIGRDNGRGSATPVQCRGMALPRPHADDRNHQRRRLLPEADRPEVTSPLG